MSSPSKESPAKFVKVAFRLHHLPDYALEVLKDSQDKKTAIQVALLGSIKELGDWQLGRHLTAKPSQRENNVWEVTADIPPGSSFDFCWLVANGDRRVLFWDPAQDHRVQISHHKTVVQVSWSRDPTYCTSRTCTMVAQTHYICQDGERLAELGSDPCLGEWNPEKCQLAYEFPRGSGNWQATIEISRKRSYNWKWAVVNETTKDIVRWEECPDRFLYTNCERVVILASWNCPSAIQEHSDKIYHHKINMKKASRFYDVVENSESLLTKEMKEVTRSWKQRRQTGEKPVVVTEVKRSAENEAMKEVKKLEMQKLKSRRSIIRKISRVINPVTSFLYNCCRCTE